MYAETMEDVEQNFILPQQDEEASQYPNYLGYNGDLYECKDERMLSSRSELIIRYCWETANTKHS